MMLNGKVEVRYGPSIYRAQDALLLTTFPELEPLMSAAGRRDG